MELDDDRDINEPDVLRGVCCERLGTGISRDSGLVELSTLDIEGVREADRRDGVG